MKIYLKAGDNMSNLFRLADGSFVVTDGLLTKRQLMQRLGRSRSTIQNYMIQGMPYVKFNNNRIGYDFDEVTEWLIDKGYPARDTWEVKGNE